MKNESLFDFVHCPGENSYSIVGGVLDDLLFQYNSCLDSFIHVSTTYFAVMLESVSPF